MPHVCGSAPSRCVFRAGRATDVPAGTRSGNRYCKPVYVGFVTTTSSDVTELVQAIVAFDDDEAQHQANTLSWLKSTADVFRRLAPKTPPNHLVAYFQIHSLATRSRAGQAASAGRRFAKPSRCRAVQAASTPETTVGLCRPPRRTASTRSSKDAHTVSM
jgi:hypothetical protein